MKHLAIFPTVALLLGVGAAQAVEVPQPVKKAASATAGAVQKAERATVRGIKAAASGVEKGMKAAGKAVNNTAGKMGLPTDPAPRNADPREQ